MRKIIFFVIIILFLTTSFLSYRIISGEYDKQDTLILKIKDIVPEMTKWRHQIHEKPEIAYQEKVTSKFIANKLKDFGVEVIEEFGKTGVVGIIQGKENKGQEKSIAIRADMDALPMTEKTNLPYSSKNEGAMHACGHDGHSTMLLGAAKYLSETKNFYS